MSVEPSRFAMIKFPDNLSSAFAIGCRMSLISAFMLGSGFAASAFAVETEDVVGVPRTGVAAPAPVPGGAEKVRRVQIREFFIRGGETSEGWVMRRKMSQDEREALRQGLNEAVRSAYGRRSARSRDGSVQGVVRRAE